MALLDPGHHCGNEDVNKVKLRPHHIVIVRSRRAMSDTARKANDSLLSAVFNPEFPFRLTAFVSHIPEDSLVEVVSANDDLCQATKCPYYELCDAGSFREAQGIMIDKAPADTPSDLIETLRHSGPDQADAEACRDLGIEIGKTYALGKLCPTKPSTATE
jgi:hypothetical protein